MKKFDGLLKIVLLVVFGSCCLWAGPNNRHFKNAAGKYGLIDDNFRVILPAEYLYAGELSEGAINVKLASNEWALIDENRKELCRVKALRLGKVINGWARVETEDYGYFYINKKGKTVGSDFDCASIFVDGKAFVTKKGENGYFIDTNGNNVSGQLPYTYASYAENGLWEVSVGSNNGIINSNYEEIVPPRKGDIYYAGEGYFVTMDPEDTTECFFLDSNGKKLSSVRFKSSSQVYDGIAFLKMPDRKGEYIYDLRKDKLTGPLENFERMNKMSKNVVSISKIDGKWKYILVHRKNEQICPLCFDEFNDEQNNIMWFEKDGKSYYVNSKGMYWSPDK